MFLNIFITFPNDSATPGARGFSSEECLGLQYLMKKTCMGLEASLSKIPKLTFCSHRYSDEYMLSKSDGKFRTVEMNSNMIHSVIDPMLLDSALGWYSNVFDLSRFMTCLMGYSQRQLLTPPMVCIVDPNSYSHSCHLYIVNTSLIQSCHLWYVLCNTVNPSLIGIFWVHASNFGNTVHYTAILHISILASFF